MGTVKRAFPMAVWLGAYLLLLFAFLPGLLLFWTDTVPAAAFPDFSPLFEAGRFSLLAPNLQMALHAALLCLVLGYPIGNLLSFFPYRTAFVSCLMPVFFLGGTALLFGQRLIPLLPYGFIPAFLTAVDGYVSPFAAMSMMLLPLMILCTCSFASAVDPALMRTARGLGASRLRAFLTLAFPCTLKGALAGFLLVFIPALALSLVSGQETDITFGFALAISAAHLLLTLIVMTVCLLVLKNVRRVSPC